MRSGLLLAILLGPLLMAVLAVVARLAADGRIPRNHLIGIRLPSTHASDVAWRAGHRAAIAPSWVCCGALVVVDVVAVLASRTVQAAGLAVGVLVLFLVGVGWVASAASRAARRAV